MKLSLGKINKPALSGFLALLLLSGVALAGSLSPSASPGSTFNTLAEVYNSIASTFDSSAISASTTGSLIQHLKYIEANMSSGKSVSSNSLDFDELANALTVDANTTITGGAFSLTFDHASVSSDFEVRGTASASKLYIGPASAGYALGATQLNVSVKIPTGAIGSVALAGSPRIVFVQGRYAYVGNQTASTLQVVDVSNPASPVTISTTALGTHPLTMYVRGRYAYIVGYTSDLLQVVDISNPARPIVMSSTATTGISKIFALQGRYAYVGGGVNGLQIIDVSNPAAPVVVGSAPGGSAMGDIAGRYLYTTGGSNNIRIFDISNPSSPVRVSSTSAGFGLSSPSAIKVQGRYLYVANNTTPGVLKIIDISNPASPTLVGSITTSAANEMEIAVQGRYVYVTSYLGDKLEVIDVSNPAAPISIGYVATAAGSFTSFVQGRYAYVPNHTAGTMQIFDMGGAYIQHFEAGTVEAATLSLRNGFHVGTEADIRGGLTVGSGLQVTGFSTINIASLSENIASRSTQSLLRLINAKGYLSGDPLRIDISIGTTQEHFTGDFAKFTLAGTNRFIVEANGNILASGSAGFGLDGSLASTAYSRFGTSATTATWITTIDDLLLSHDLQVLGSASFSGNIGIGTANLDAKFELVGGTGITTQNVASISATSLAGGSVFNLRLPASSQANNAHGLLLAQDTAGRVIASWSMGGALSIAGALRSDGAVSNCTGVNTPTSGCIDYAESYPTADTTLSAGELVAVALSGVEGQAIASVARATPGSTVLGVVSTNPASLIDDNSLKSGSLAKSSPGTVPLALAGRVPVRISGPVSAGDHLTLSDIPGTAKTQTEAGMSVGIALESASSGSVMTFVNLGYWAPGLPSEALAKEGIFARFVDYLKGMILTVKELVTERVQTKQLCLEDVCIEKSQLRELLDRSRVQPAEVPVSTPSISSGPVSSPQATPESIASSEIASSPDPTPEPSPTPIPESSPTEIPTPEAAPVEVGI